MFTRLWGKYLRKHIAWIAVALVLMVIEGSTLGVLSYMLQPMFDTVFVEGRGDAIMWVGLGIFGLFIVRAVTSVAQRIIMTRIGTLTTVELQKDLLAHVMNLDNAFYQTNPPGVLIERVQGDAMAMQQVWQAIITGAGRDTVALLSLMVVAIIIDPIWTLVAVIGVPLLVLPTAIVQRYIRRKSGAMREISAYRTTRLDEIFHGVTPVKLNSLEPYQQKRFASLTDNFVTATIKSAAGTAVIPGLVDLSVGLGFFCVLLYGGQEIISGEKTIGQFMSFFTAMALAFQPLRRLGSIAGVWQTTAASLERVFRIFDTAPTIVSPAKPLAPATDTTIEFTDVHLSYGDAPVLRGLNITARAGQTTALVGASGAGKSTVFNLLTRLVDADSGVVSVGGRDVTQLDLGQLRHLFSVVSQDALLFDESLRDNILLGREDVSDEVLKRALDAAYVTEFLDGLNNGLDSPAGPRGSSLSGGQRQRIAIARAILRDTPILLLDEATSALDTASEAKVQQALEALSVGRTTLVIAHRLSTVQAADKIYVFDHGGVVEEGTHAKLMTLNGVYARLNATQNPDGTFG
jgi:subfamily B ATP-binding cassette protein MsbA